MVKAAVVPGTLIIRADAGSNIGVGHVMRCLALAQVWRMRGGAVVFVGDIPADVSRSLQQEGMRVCILSTVYPDPNDLKSVERLATNLEVVGGLSWIVADGYNFDCSYLEGLKKTGLRVMNLGDFAYQSGFPSDIFLNQGLGAATLHHATLLGKVSLLGERYRMIRREFVLRRDLQRTIPEQASKLMVMMGGADSRNVTSDIVSALAKGPCKEMDICVVIGPANRHVSKLEALAASLRMPRLQLLIGADIHEVMAQSEMAVSAGGSSLGELAYMGVPSVVVIVADNQEQESRRFGELGAVRCLGCWEDLDGAAVADACASLAMDKIARRNMVEAGKRIVDGCGADRVVDCMLQEELE